MRLLGLVIGLLVILVGAAGLAVPNVLLSLGQSAATPGGLYARAALRFALGLIFVLAAPASRAPRTLRVLGVIMIIAGLTTLWLGIAHVRAILDSWTATGLLGMRLVACVAMAIGGLLVYAFRSPAARSGEVK